VAQKRTVLDTLAKLSCPPQGMTVDEALADNYLFGMWLDNVFDVHMGAKLVCKSPP
jgi:hypothetical protein